MPQATDFLAFIIAFFVLLFTFGLLAKLRKQDVFKDRLDQLSKHKAHLSAREEEARIYTNPEDIQYPGLQGFLAKIQRSSSGEQKKLTRLFEKAGLKSRNASLVYGLAKIVMIFPPSIITGFIVFNYTQWPFLFKIVAIIGAALIGSYLVDFVLNKMVAVRQEKIQKAF